MQSAVFTQSASMAGSRLALGQPSARRTSARTVVQAFFGTSTKPKTK